MAGYIGAKVGTVTANAADIKGDISATDTTPELILKNTSEEDTEGGREGKITFKGEQSGGEESTLAQIESAHDGTSDDQKGDLIFKTNDGSDGASPTERVRIDSNGSILTATLGTDNVHLGEGAGASIASGGDNNVAIGKDAGTALTTGDNNVAVGYEALKTEDAHGNNTAVGYRTLKTQNAGANAANTALGYIAGTDITTGIRNTIIGAFSGDDLTDADYNVTLGFGALGSDTKGNKSIAIGVDALTAQNHTSSTDTHNIAVGYNAGAAVTTGLQNTIVGNEAADAVTTGSYNTIVGYNAGGAFNADYNILVGRSSGSAITSGSKNTIIGSYNGNQNGLDIRTANNNIVLSDGDGNPNLAVNGNGYTRMGRISEMASAYSVNRHLINTFTTGSAIVEFNHSTGTSPYGLHIKFDQVAPDNNSNWFLRCQDSTTNRLYIYSDGDIDNHDNSYSGISDKKLKQQITDASSQWDDIKALQVRKYKMNEDVEAHGDSDDHWRLGVIAQELETAGMSGLVNDRPDKDDDDNDLGTTTKSVKYSILYMKAVKALQEAMTRIETLETKVAALEAE